MISTRRKRAVVCLLLLAVGEVAQGAGITSSPYFTVSYGTHCESITQYTLDAFESTYFGVRPVVVEGGYLIATYPAHSPDPKKYRVEGARGSGIQTCTICPYDEFVAADGLNKMAYGLGGLPYEPSPMYGPCLDLARSMKTACVQNTLFYPPSFVGEYFYPDQSLFASLYVGGTNPSNFARHALLIDASLPVLTAPTAFGLGKQRVTQQIESVRIVDKNTLAVNLTLTTEFMKDYAVMTPAEGWLLWAQHQCNPGCHRNAEYQQVSVRTSDWQGQSAVLQHLNRQDTSGNKLSRLLRCHLCPPYHAAYIWNVNADTPLSPNLEWNAIAQTCFPWFGAIPIFDSLSAYSFKEDRRDAHSEATDGVLSPSSSTYYASTPCASGTYNNVCAHSLRYYKQVAMNPLTPAAEAAAAALKAQCKPCPAGYHTDGQTGAWFCLPPPGIIFGASGRMSLLLHVEGANNQSIAWSRRNRIGYEFECGYKLEHCKQCALLGMTAMMPDEFNQKLILDVILKTAPCAEGFYCTHSFRAEPVACPLDKPWSPAGSYSISQCTCARGTFLNALGKCEACLAINSCPKGQYLSGWNACIWLNGMTSPGVCVACTNVPAANAIVMAGGGIEWSYADQVGGACPFRCAAGYEMVAHSNAPTDCAVVWRCDAVPPYKNADGALVYSEGLLSLTEELQVIVSGTAGRCAGMKQLRAAMTANLKAGPPAFLPVSATCINNRNPTCTLNAPCRLKTSPTYYADVVCEACPSPPSGATFTFEAKLQSIAIGDLGSMCQSTCGDGSYENKTTRTCASCATLSARVCTPPGQISGGGCLGNVSVPFPLWVQSMTSDAWCVSCGSPMPPPGQYLDTVTCANKTCEARTDTINYDKYFNPKCGGSTKGLLVQCTDISACNSSTEFLAGECTADTNRKCTACQTFKPGYYMNVSCTHAYMDAIWKPCPAGYTCNGGMQAPQPCPYPKTSFEGSAVQCICPAGTVLNAMTGACNYQTCSDKPATLMPADIRDYGNPSPGNLGLSSFYMQLSELYSASDCLSCGLTGGKTYDAHPIGQSSCRCPFGSFMDSGVCTACSVNPTTCQGCWRGDVVCSNQPTFAPLLSESGCPAGFDKLLSETSDLTGTGSAAYVAESDFRQGWTSHKTVGSGITHMAVTSSKSDDGAPNAVQVAFYMQMGAPLVIYAQPLPGAFRATDAPIISSDSWSLSALPAATISDNFYAAQLAVSSWPAWNGYASAPTAFDSITAAVVGVVVYNTNIDTLNIFINFASVVSAGTVRWQFGEAAGASAQAEVLINNFPKQGTSVTAMQHQYAYPGVFASASAFYIAVNDVVSCRVLAYNVNKLETQTLVLGESCLITAMAVTVAAAVPVLYVAFDATPDRITMIPWSTTTAIVQTDEIFFSAYVPGMQIQSLSFSWSTDTLLWARVMRHLVTPANASNTQLMGTSEIYVTDKDYQRTLTRVQQMPAGTHPTVGPFAVSVGPKQAWLLSTFASSLYLLPMQRCSVFPGAEVRAQFWPDVGGACLLHSCLRRRSCAGDSRQTWNKATRRCECTAGYYPNLAGACLVCPPGSYCNDNTKKVCPLPFTSDLGAQTEQDCACAIGRAYVPTTGQCAICAAGSWCPNRYESFLCPGSVDATRTSSKEQVFPTLCTCAVGFTGPGCTPCPAGLSCPKSSGTTTNHAVKLTLMLTATNRTLLSPCQAIERRLYDFVSASDRGALTYCTYLAATTAYTRPTVVAMIQTTSLAANNVRDLKFNSTSEYTVMDAPLYTFGLVYTNTPITCSKDGSKTPTTDAAGCWCAAGWKTNSNGACAACEPNTYKPLAGPCDLKNCPNGGCLACPSGMTSGVAASACAAPLKVSSNATSTSSSTAVNIPAVVGGVVGGVVLLAIILFAVNQLYVVPAATVMSAGSA